ncbi:MAG: alpha/beta hydrolase family protein [Usitatibacter sp.]
MIRAAAALAALALALPARGAEEKLSIETLFKPAQYASMRLSPKGDYLAALAPVEGKQNIVVIDLASRKAYALTNLTTRDVIRADWINDKRLMFQTGTIGEQVFDARGGGILAIDRDGGVLRVLSEGDDRERNTGGIRFMYRGMIPVRFLPGETDDIIMQEVIGAYHESRVGGLYRVDTRTGRKTSIGDGKPESANSERWVVDRDGVARAFSVSVENSVRIYYRDAADAPWRKLDEFDQLSGAGWTPVAMATDEKRLIVSTRRGGDKSVMALYDPATKAIVETLAAHPQVDLEGLVRDKEAVRGVRYEADREGHAWFDEDIARVQATIDKALPGFVNDLSWSLDKQKFVVLSYSDVSPGTFYLFDRKAGKLEWLADRMPWIDPKKLSPVEPVRYRARDGLEIPAYLTIPKDGPRKNLPLVMVIHGGPWVTGDGWHYNPEVQFLASRGYAVLQPNYRGTLRYGWKHYASSFKQWGLTMQDDITDGVKWAVEQGIADPKRVCIYGGSYGGYATMMGLAKTPELYKCGINYVGVTDLNLMLGATWSDFAYSDYIRYSSKRLVGDPDKDAEQLKATSPTQLASRIKAPVLMAYGGADVRVPIQHGTEMKSALESQGMMPIWIVASGEGHGFRSMENKVMFYGAMEKFLDANIGAAK